MKRNPLRPSVLVKPQPVNRPETGGLGWLGRRPLATNDLSSATVGVSYECVPPEETAPATCGRVGAATCKLEDKGVGEMLLPSPGIVTDDLEMETAV